MPWHVFWAIQPLAPVFEAAAANNLTHQQATWGLPHLLQKRWVKIWHIHIIYFVEFSYGETTEGDTLGMRRFRSSIGWPGDLRLRTDADGMSDQQMALGCWGGKIWSCQMMWVPGQLCELETLQFTFLFLCLNLCSPNICSSQKYIKIKIFPHVLYAVAWGHAKQ